MQFQDLTPPGDLFVNADHRGDLLVVVPKGRVTVTTKYGDSDAGHCDVYVVKPDGTIGDTYMDAKLLGRGLAGQIGRAQPGVGIIARFVEGEARNGNRGPHLLEPANEADRQLAMRAMSSGSVPEPQGAATAAPAGDKPPWEQ